MGDETSRSLLDKEIMNVFEEREDQFSFPITTEKDARDFVKLLNKHGCTYDIISKEVREDEERFRDWRLGGGSVEIGKLVIERINRPFRDTMFSESESDDRRSSLNDFYQFSFEEEEVITSKGPEMKIFRNIESTKETRASNLPSDKSKTNLSPNNSSQANISSSPREILSSEHPSSTTTSSKVEQPKCSFQLARPVSPTPPKNKSDTKQNVEKMSDMQRPQPAIPIASNLSTQHREASATSPEKIKNSSSALQPSSEVQNILTSTSTSSAVTPPIVTPPTLKNSEASIEKMPQISPSKSTPPQTTTSPEQKNIPPIPQATPGTSNTSKGVAETTDEERPPSPVTTSPHYQPIVVNFPTEELEPIMNYNSDDQAEGDEKGFIYIFSDIPSPTMKSSKHTKFRVRIGTSRDPVKRLQQALLFNPDIRLLASIPINSRSTCKPLLRECLKPIQMKNKLDWYWATLNSIFASIDVVLQKCT